MTSKTSQDSRKKREKTDRLFWADVVRVLAIFLVVLDHNNFISQNASVGNQATGYVISSVARIGVPLFVMLSGALLLTRETSYTYFFKRRIFKVLVPWISWAGIYTIWFFYTREIPSMLGDIGRLFYQTFFGQFWYLWMLWGLYFLTPILWKFLKAASSKDVLYAVILWFVFASLFPFLYHLYSPYSPISQNYIFLHLGFYILGYYFLTQKINVSRNVLLSIFFSSVLIQSTGLWYLFSLTPPMGFLNTNNSIFIVSATVALFIIIYVSLKNTIYNVKKISHKFLNFLSGASFFVFLSHGLAMEILRKFQIIFVPEQSMSILFASVFNTSVVVGSCLLLYVFLKRVPFIANLFAVTSK